MAKKKCCGKWKKNEKRCSSCPDKGGSVKLKVKKNKKSKTKNKKAKSKKKKAKEKGKKRS